MDKSFIFKMVWRGWFVGATIIFIPLIMLTIMLSPEAPKSILLSVFLIPLIAALQGLIVGGLVILGLTIWPPKNK